MKKILFILVSGNLLAQIINAIFIPISTRLYSPEDFKDLSVFISILMIISTVGGARFDAAILKAENGNDAFGLLVLATIIASTVSFIVLLLLAIIKISNIYVLDYYYWFLPFLVIAVVVYNSLCNINNINSEFTKLSKSRVSQAISGNLTLSIWGYVVGTPFGLVLGYSLMYCAGVFLLWDKKLHLERGELKKIYGKYIEYPKYSVLESLSDVAGYQLPIALIGIFIQSNLAGYLFIAIKIMNIPITILGRALSSIYIVKIRKNKYQFKLYRSMILCLILGLASLFFCGWFFQEFSNVLIGNDWIGLDNIIFLILPWFLLQFLTTIFNPMFYIFSREKFISQLQIIANFLRIIFFILALWLDGDNIVIYLSVINSIFYLTWIFGIFHIFKKVEYVKN